jgi:T5SS/PEP-CTERM-associated repeat protein
MASAQTTDWTNAAGDGSWSDAGNWDNGVPATGYTANITSTLGLNQTITYDYTGAAVNLNTLTVDLTGGIGTASSVLSMSANTLTVTNEYVGDSGSGSNGVGTFNQSGGNNAASNALYLGYNSTDTGFYTLSSTSSLSVAYGTEYVGYNGTGIFNQTGGTNNGLNFLYLASQSGSVGEYTLSGSGSLSYWAEYIGLKGAGIFNQSGGTSTISNYVVVGYYSSGTGTYILSGTGTLVVGQSGEFGLNEVLGFSGTGVFNQSGGLNSLIDGAFLAVGGGAGSTGTYMLSGTGTLSDDGFERLGDGAGNGGTGTFSQSGGLNTITGSNSLEVGCFNGSNGAYTLGGTGSLSVSGNEYVGFTSAAVFTQTAGTNSLTGASSTLCVGNANTAEGAYTLSGGALVLTGNTSAEIIGNFGTGTFDQSGGLNQVPLVNPEYPPQVIVGENAGSTGTYYLSGGTLATGGFYVGDQYIGQELVGFNGTGTFNQSGGTNSVDRLFVGYNAGSTGAYILSGTGSVAVTGAVYLGYNGNSTGTYALSGSGSIWAGSEYVGYSGVGNFSQSGGTNSAILYLGYSSGSTGTYTLSGTGTLLVNDDDDEEIVGYSGTGIFNQSAGLNDVGGLDLGSQKGSTGTYTLSGTGTLMAGGESVGEYGTGVFNQTGGTNTTSHGNLDLGLPLGSGSFTISGGVTTVGGNVVEYGGGVLSVSNSGQLSVAGTLTVYSGGRANINGGSTTIGGLSIPASGIVNMNAAMAIDYASPTSDPVSTIVGYLTNGYNSGNWAGTSGIISTSAAASVGQTPLYSVGYADGDNAYDLGKVSGLQPNQMLVMYTLAGDANLDGTVNFADLLIVAQNFNKTGEDWVGGNFTYNPTGLVNFADILIVAQNFNQSLADSSSITIGGTIAPLAVKVPEPGAICLIAGMGAGLLGRRRRRRR